MGPLCATGCRATHEKCECWRIRRAPPQALEALATQSAQARYLKDLEALTAGAYTRPHFGSTETRFVAYMGCLYFPQCIRQGDTGRCDQNGLG